MDIDFLIVGQGLAGSLLAFELIQRNARVMVVDDGRENASQVAAGLINPVTGMRLVKSDRVDDCLPEAKALYSRLSKIFDRTFFVEKTMFRLLRNEIEVAQSQKRLNAPEYGAYLSKIHPRESFAYPFQDCCWLLEQKQTGYLNTRPLLNALRDFFIGLDSYRKISIDFRGTQVFESFYRQGLKPKRVIFCEGYRLIYNPWFSWLPLQAVKGEILTIESDFALPEQIINFGNWLIPIGKNRCRTGATFDRHCTDTAITEQAKHQLIQSLAKIDPRFESKTRIVDQQANIRPCTPDRMPFLGRHPANPKLWVFNGFGAKGSLQIPWYSRHLADALLNGSDLDNHCNIQRYYETHFFGSRSA
ncbi:MAG: FAD-binding oxidoreductase [Gammaproteobacteria bacterium]|nr:FAD-binding oxidoreductase [Gammaproteobacteria bacterium]